MLHESKVGHYILGVILTLFCANVFAQSSSKMPCDKISEPWAAEAFDSLKNSIIFIYYIEKFGPIKYCSYSSTSEEARKVRRLTVGLSHYFEAVVSDVTTDKDRFSWQSFSAPAKMADTRGIYLSMIYSFSDISLKLDWNRYKIFSEDPVFKVYIYCDPTYKTGTLGMARFKHTRLVSIQFGFFNRNHCPNSLQEFNELVHGK